MENLEKMNGFELLQALKATSCNYDFADDFNEIYEHILNQAKEKHDLSVLKKAQDLRWKQTEYLVQQWLKNYPKTEPQTGWTTADGWMN